MAITTRSGSVLAAMTVAAVAVSSAPISYHGMKRGHLFFHVVQADLSSGYATATTVAPRGLHSFSDLVRTRKPEVAITGTFFNTANGQPVGDVLSEGDLLARGARGSVIAIDWNNRPAIFDTTFSKPMDWSRFKSGLRGTVRIVRDGVVASNPRAQQFRDPRIWGRARRAAAGITSSGKLLLVATSQSVTLNELGWAMVKAGAVDAVNLDGGSSTALQYRGKMLVQPQRKLSNLLIVNSVPGMTPNEHMQVE